VVRPYRYFAYWIKLVGDIAYLVSIIMLLYYQSKIGDDCIGPDARISQGIFICLLIFVAAYLISFFITPFLNNRKL
jgi:hypothetical protein